MENKRKELEDILPETLYEIKVGGHIHLVGKKAYIDYLMEEDRLCDIIKRLGGESK